MRSHQATGTFKENLSEIIDKNTESSEDMKILAQASKILRRENLRKQKNFTGRFCDTAESDVISPAMSSFLHMLIDGPYIDVQNPPISSKKLVLSLGQLIVHNMVKRRSLKPESIPRHIRERETPQSLMIAMKIHMKTGKECLVDMLAQRGICVSYKRLRQISTDIANSVITDWERKGVVVPSLASRGIFTTGGVDNIDYNPSSTTALPQSVLHVTSISVLQHFSLSQVTSIKEQDDIMYHEEMGKKDVKPSPISYTMIDDVSLPRNDTTTVPNLKDLNSHPFIASNSLNNILQDGYNWLDHVSQRLKDTLGKEEWISWAAYYATQSNHLPQSLTRSHVLPLLMDTANSPMTIMHCMKIIKRTTEYLNPGQTPVIVADQPLFTIAKRLQWEYHDSAVSEDNYLVMLGAMHIEKMLWTVSGDWLQCSGWTTAIHNSAVATSGTAQSFLGATHICRTRYVHQVSASALYVLMKKAYTAYTEMMQDGDPRSSSADGPPTIQEWIQQKCLKQPQADFWFKAMELDLLILQVMNKSLINYSYQF